MHDYIIKPSGTVRSLKSFTLFNVWTSLADLQSHLESFHGYCSASSRSGPVPRPLSANISEWMSTPCYLVLLSTISFASTGMPISGGNPCVVFNCLRILAICAANTILATGWLIMSVLSVLVEWADVFDAPPTFPKLPTRQTTNETDIKPAQDEAVKTAVATAKPSLAPATLERIQVQRANSLEHAQSAQEQTIPSSPVSPVSPEPPSTATSLSTLAESIAHGSLPPSANGSSSLLPLSSPPKDANHRARGRKLMLFRMSSTERSQSSSHSSERLDYGVKPCIKRVASGLDFVPIPHHHHKQSRQRPRSPVRRTDPYQAPYFFPSPLSPDAAGYVQRVRLELGGNSPENPSIPLPPASAPPAVIPRNQPIEDVHHEGEAPALAPHITSDEGANPDKTVAPQRSRERPVSWNCSSSLHSRPSTSSMERSRMASSPSPSPAKKFWSRKVIRQGSAPTPLTPHDDRHTSPASPSPPASPNTELKRKRTWFRRRHSLSIATLPSPNAHVTEFGELPQDASQRH